MLSEEIAKNTLASEDPYSTKGLRLDDNKHEFTVTGVFLSLSLENAHMHPGDAVIIQYLKGQHAFWRK
jgi:hypothetical protein